MVEGTGSGSPKMQGPTPPPEETQIEQVMQ